MRATDILSAEHRVIEQVCAAMNEAATRLEGGEPVRPGFFFDAARFIQGFADGCHHRKEEGVLFATMAANGMPTQGGPIAVMLYEHEQGRGFTAAMKAAAERLQAGDASARAEAIASARAYATLLTQHIFKEDHILFPMAGNVIPTDEHDEVLAGFERVEHEEAGPGAHEQYLALADSLVREMGGSALGVPEAGATGCGHADAHAVASTAEQSSCCSGHADLR
jgi:hemerythrin-like domain-containing protein